ncbi:asparaginase/glutaminase [Candidatus Protofrankia californiensis]|uniref:Asparaginase/glutaminase n=1 Tax=Candidatus Protofrankia californiensis TaxID=1839754 RepID=A0A1C3P1T4_9ACTN|nr:asparaginase/glutaminase [Candidatus Protofrankia californiensis]
MSDARADQRRVLVVSLGGTIAMTAAADGGVAPALTAGELLAAVPGLAETGIAVESVDFRRLPGASLGFEDLTAVAELLRKRMAVGLDGVVVVQGTDTIEETAYLLDLHHAGSRPVVVTGAMRNPTMAGADGPANLLAAVRTAASSAACDLGCLVVLADEVHAARRVRKTHSTAGSTFHSPNGGPLGYLVEGQPRFLSCLPYRVVVPAPVGDHPFRVPLVTVTFGDDGLLVDALGERVDGAVIAGFGAGHVPASLVPALGDLAGRVPVVLASRTGAGSVLTATYGFPGSERDLLGRGLIAAGFLDAYKARILLRTLLAAGADRTMIEAAFAVEGGYAPPDRWPWAGSGNASKGR